MIGGRTRKREPKRKSAGLSFLGGCESSCFVRDWVWILNFEMVVVARARARARAK